MGLLFLPAIAGLSTGAVLFVVVSFALVVFQRVKSGIFPWGLHALALGFILFQVSSSEELQRAQFFIVSYVAGAVTSYVALSALIARSLSEEGKAKRRNLLVWIISLSLGLFCAFGVWNVIRSTFLPNINVQSFLAMMPHLAAVLTLGYSAIAIFKNRKYGLYALVAYTCITTMYNVYFALTFDSKWFEPGRYMISVLVYTMPFLFAIAYLYSRKEYME